MSLAVLLVLAFQVPPTERDQDLALQKGLKFLKAGISAEDAPSALRELALWALLAAGEDPKTPVMESLLKDVLLRPPESTASAARQAIVLGMLDPETYRARILHCAQFLIDNQAADGLWGAGEPVNPVVETPLDKPPPKRAGPRKTLLRRLREGPKEGDPLNARWAAWGLHAAAGAGVKWPEETSQRALATWRVDGRNPADAVAFLSLWHYYSSGKDWKQHADVKAAVERLAAAERPGDPASWFVLKRTLVLYNSEKLGGWEWWPDGVAALLKSQAPDGGWGGLEPTCWALLMLDIPSRKR